MKGYFTHNSNNTLPSIVTTCHSILWYDLDVYVYTLSSGGYAIVKIMLVTIERPTEIRHQLYHSFFHPIPPSILCLLHGDLNYC